MPFEAPIGERCLVLANRNFAYSLLARTFAEEPDEKFADIFCAEHARDELMLIEDEQADSIMTAYEKARECLLPCLAGSIQAQGDAGADKTLALLRSEYAGLFIGPTAPSARPWESLHVAGRQAIFQAEVLEVRRGYRDAGYLPASYPRVADDFIGIEMDFMAKLAGEAVSAYGAGNPEACEDRLAHSRLFIKRHLGTWIDGFAHAIEESRPESFYRWAAEIAVAYVSRDRVLLDALMAG